MNGDRIPDPAPFGQSVDEIDEQLLDCARNEARHRDQLLGALTAIDGVAQRREILLERRSDAAARARAATESAG